MLKLPKLLNALRLLKSVVGLPVSLPEADIQIHNFSRRYPKIHLKGVQSEGSKNLISRLCRYKIPVYNLQLINLNSPINKLISSNHH